eukprot:TRINITY_DN336_c0_g1_i1.p1 TRINITY_DN336_c0_g1~~TRINITY_DN336_c0_g1_i1.p1  ORF type:complete len:928 (+),score=301.06 TRINITY_DN336_c0_g1_i1:88-2871(+)
MAAAFVPLSTAGPCQAGALEDARFAAQRSGYPTAAASPRPMTPAVDASSATGQTTSQNAAMVAGGAAVLSAAATARRRNRAARRNTVKRNVLEITLDLPQNAEELGEAAEQFFGPPPQGIVDAAAAASSALKGLSAPTLPSMPDLPTVGTGPAEALKAASAALPKDFSPEVMASLLPAELIKVLDKPELLEPIVGPAGAAAATVLLLWLRRGPQWWLDKLPDRYEPEWIASYWTRRPFRLLSKLAVVSVRSSAFLLARELDKLLGKEQENMPERAIQARELVTELGVAFIKVGQIWAARPDILPEAYSKEFVKLLEQVPAFTREEAFVTLRRNLNDVERMFGGTKAFDEPIAAASVGQVYKAQYNGKTVAVKVQRPDVREQVTLDVYVILTLCRLGLLLPIDTIKRQCRSSLELISYTAPTWFEELDYEKEANNQKRFAQTVEECDLISSSVVVPEVFISTREVLVQQWLDGKKLNEQGIAQENQDKVVPLLLNAYMVQFLETGYLHGDPHPGNFVVLPSGQLGILDYGLMTEIPNGRRVAFIEYLMHLQAKDYDKCLNDLINLGFIPADIADDTEAKQIIIPALTQTLDTLYGEGGDMKKKSEIFKAQREEMKSSGKLDLLRSQLQGIAKKYGSFQLPGYFTLIIRAFSLLEGLGLRVNKDFSIVQECFPYIARRLLTDDTLRIREALKSYLYMGGKRIAIKRVDDLTSGFGTFTNLMKGDRTEYLVGEAKHEEHKQDSEQEAPKPVVLDDATKDIAEVIFSKDGNFLQDLLIDEGIAAIDALSRAALVRVLSTLGPLALPISLPLNLVYGNDSENRILTEEDEEALTLLGRIVDLLQPAGQAAAAASESSASSREGQNATVFNAARQLQRLQPLAQGLLPVVLPGASAFAQRFSQQLARRVLLRLANDLEQGVGLRRPVAAKVGA